MKKKHFLAAVFTLLFTSAAIAETAGTTNDTIDNFGRTLVYLGPGLFLAIIAVLFGWARKEKLKLSELLAERNLPDNHPATATGTATLQNVQQNQGGGIPAGTPQNVIAPATPPPSSSRLVMLLAGLAAVVISIVLSSYSIFSLQRYGTAPDWSSFTAVLLALGIGVVPYSTKQVFK